MGRKRKVAYKPWALTKYQGLIEVPKASEKKRKYYARQFGHRPKGHPASIYLPQRIYDELMVAIQAAEEVDPRNRGYIYAYEFLCEMLAEGFTF